MKKYISLILIITCVLCLVGCNNSSKNDVSIEEYSISGTILELNKSSALIENESGEYWVSLIIRDGSLPELAVGDEIIVSFNGAIAESYPMQINTVYSIKILD